MPIANDDRFLFAAQGYLHLRGVLSAAELEEIRGWVEEVHQKTDIQTLNADNPEGIAQQLNRPLSRVIDADARFGRFLDHPAVEPFLVEFLGQNYRHIDNDLYFTFPGYAGGKWHRGVRAHPGGHLARGAFICPMVKVFYCLTDVGPGMGEFVVVPGSHHVDIEIDLNRIDLPGQHIFDDVLAGDVIIFNEALLHNGRPNPSDRTRQTIIVNFGREDAGPWPGYRPHPATLEALTPRQREIFSNQIPVWQEPELVDA